MAINAIDKLEFFSFIFAVLLSIIVHFIALRLGRTIMHQHTKILLNFYKKLCYCRGTARHTCQYKFCNYKTSHLKTRVPGLSCSIICVILRLAVLIQYRSVTDTHTHTHRERERERERERLRQTHDDGIYRA